MMAGYRAVGVLLAAAMATLLAAAAGVADDEHMFHWKCFKSCTNNCHGEEDAAALDAGAPSGRCKTGCLKECFEELPVLCYQQCVVKSCLCLPPYSKEKMTCMKTCCTKCFHHGPKPGPKPNPGPPAPQPGPPPPNKKPYPPGPGLETVNSNN